MKDYLKSEIYLKAVEQVLSHERNWDNYELKHKNNGKNK